MTSRIAAVLALLILSPVPSRAAQVVDWEVGPKQQTDKPAPPGG